jgi:hypothetical protein
MKQAEGCIPELQRGTGVFGQLTAGLAYHRQCSLLPGPQKLTLEATSTAQGASGTRLPKTFTILWGTHKSSIKL